MKKIQIDDIFVSNSGDVARVVEYIDPENVRVVFDGFTRVVSVVASNLRTGKFRNKEKPDKFNTILGEGFNSTEHARVYRIWRDMIRRCFYGIPRTYVGVTVSDEWHVFSNFATWYYSQVGCNNTSYEIDKDLSRASIYSKNTCFLVPCEINNLFKERVRDKGLPRGVTHCKVATNRPYVCIINTSTGRYQEYFSTVEEARSMYLVKLKEHVEYLAVKYKGFIDDKCIDVLREYDLETLK